MLRVKIKKFCNLTEHLWNPIYLNLYMYIIPLLLDLDVFTLITLICPNKF